MEEGAQEVPKWLKELEDKRERRLKARLGHEAGAGSPCLTCESKCPGLDLHFWRKICKNCKCGKENHDVNEDDMYGWAQFQLLGSKPNKSRKIVLPGRKDTLELEWTPKGQSDAVEFYLKELSPNVLPIKGSAAAQERKQMLQKQLPLHDIDPGLCDALTDTEVKLMQNYIAHVKEDSAGVGSVLKLSDLLIESRLVGVRADSLLPKSETVVLQGFEHANPLDQVQVKNTLNKPGLNALQPLGDLNNPVVENRAPQSFGILAKNPKILPHYTPGTYGNVESVRRPLEGFTIRDVPGETNFNSGIRGLSNVKDEEEDDKAGRMESGVLPHYAMGKYDGYSEERVPKTFGGIKDLAYSTHDPGFPDPANPKGLAYSVQPSDPKFLNNYNSEQVNIIENVQNPQLLDNYSLQDVQNNPIGHTGPIDQEFNVQKTEQFEVPKGRLFNIPEVPEGISKTQQFSIPEFEQRDILESLRNPASMNQRNRPLLDNYNPQDQPSLYENLQNPSQINVGAINDVEYPVNEMRPGQARTLRPRPPTNPNESVKLPECHRCKKAFDENAVVVGIDRNDSLWHSACFKCKGCNQSLADLMYFYDKEGDDIYCLRDYAKIRGIPRCQACDELIFVKEYCLAESCTFHVKHFCCFECDVPLAGRNYVMEDGQPLCLSCFESVKAERCAGCRKPIKPDEQGANLGGTHFHADDCCFVCKVCGKALLGAKLLFRNGCLYCSATCFGTDKK